jgi:hypothetical protein
MSGFTQTTNELLYAYYGAGTVSVPTASPGSSMTLGYPPITVPGGYMSNVGERSSSLKLVGGGLFIATATLPTIQFSLWRTTAQPATYANSGSAVLLGSSLLAVASAVTTGCPFDMEWNIGLRTAGVVNGAGSNTSTVTCFGKVSTSLSATATNTPNIWPVPTPGATYSPTDTAWPQDQQVYLWPTILVTGATAGNTVTMEWLKLYGEN